MFNCGASAAVAGLFLLVVFRCVSVVTGFHCSFSLSLSQTKHVVGSVGRCGDRTPKYSWWMTSAACVDDKVSQFLLITSNRFDTDGLFPFLFCVVLLFLCVVFLRRVFCTSLLCFLGFLPYPPLFCPQGK